MNYFTYASHPNVRLLFKLCFMPLTKQQKHFIFVLCFVRAALDFLEGTESAETRQTRYKRKRLDLKINVASKAENWWTILWFFFTLLIISFPGFPGKERTQRNHWQTRREGKMVSGHSNSVMPSCYMIRNQQWIDLIYFRAYLGQLVWQVSLVYQEPKGYREPPGIEEPWEVMEVTWVLRVQCDISCCELDYCHVCCSAYIAGV